MGYSPTLSKLVANASEYWATSPLFLVEPVGIEPTLLGLHASALTTSAKVPFKSNMLKVGFQ